MQARNAHPRDAHSPPFAGLTDTEIVDLHGDPAAGGIRRALKFPRNAEFHPLKCALVCD